MSWAAGKGFYYVHIPKTGGGSIASFMAKSGLAKRAPWVHGSGHIPSCDLPRKVRHGKKLFCTVRNPWDWYASYFHYFHCSDGSPKPPMSGFSRGTPPNFKEAVYRMTHPERLKEVPFVIGCQVRAKDLLDMVSLKIGFYSWMLLTWTARNRTEMAGLPPMPTLMNKAPSVLAADVLMDTARINEGLPLLMRLWERWDDDLQEAWEAWPKQNNNRPEQDKGACAPSNTLLRTMRTSELYDEESASWVRERDELILKLMSYEKPDSKAPSAVVWP